MANHINRDSLRAYVAELNLYRAMILAGKPVDVSISNGNNKTGAVASVSTLPGITCPARCMGTCGADCYAAKLANLRPSVRKAYARNTAVLQLAPDQYWNAVNAACKAVRYFRFHVSGDIIGPAYFARIIETARNNPGTEIMLFTKRWETVNAWIDANGDLPGNLHVLFSGWGDMKPVNPYSLPETNVYPKGGEPDPSWLLCGGNCFECACRGVGCWQAKRGDVIAFEKH